MMNLLPALSALPRRHRSTQTFFAKRLAVHHGVLKPVIALSLILLFVSTNQAQAQPENVATPATPDQPNIIIFLVDDMGLMDTSLPFLVDANGAPERHPLNDLYRTPNMERLAAQGVRFSTFYAQSVCSPTRISILTGQNAARHRTTAWIAAERNNRGPFGPPDWRWTGIAADDVTLARVLQADGYRTIHIGKAHLGCNDVPGADPRNLGFDVNIAGNAFGQPGSYFGEDGYGHIRGNASRAVLHLEDYHGTNTFLSEALTLEAIAEMDRSVEAGKPFFLHLAHYAVHTPFQSDPRFAEHYADLDLANNAKRFATLIEGIDQSLGDVMDHLEATGIAENTLILFLGDNGSDAPLGSDHGHHSSAPLRGRKATQYEGGMRVPFIAAWAAADETVPAQQRLPIAAGVMQTQMGTVMELFPTLLALADLPMPEGHVVDGVDLATRFTGASDAARSTNFLMHFPHHHRTRYFTVLREDDWKLIYHYFPDTNEAANLNGSHYELFNLAEDPYETDNRADREPEHLARMVSAMIDQLEAEHALYPVDAEGSEVWPVLP